MGPQSSVKSMFLVDMALMCVKFWVPLAHIFGFYI